MIILKEIALLIALQLAKFIYQTVKAFAFVTYSSIGTRQNRRQMFD